MGSFPRPRAFFTVLFILFVCVITGLSAIDRGVLFRSLEGDFLTKIDDDVSIDWTGGYIFARARIRLPRVILDRRQVDFDSSDTAVSMTDARAIAGDRAREQASLRLMRALSFLRLDSDFLFIEKMESDRALRYRMGELPSLFIEKTRSSGEGFESVELALPFYGEKGLYSMLAGEHYSAETVPETTGPVVPDRMTGIIIDVSEFPGFQPSLEPGIFTDQGRRIYGAGTVSRNCAVRRGLASYYDQESKARQDRRLGFAPYYVFAAGLRGRNRSDVFLDSVDIMRILGSESGRNALKKCAVVFVVPRS